MNQYKKDVCIAYLYKLNSNAVESTSKNSTKVWDTHIQSTTMWF